MASGCDNTRDRPARLRQMIETFGWSVPCVVLACWRSGSRRAVNGFGPGDVHQRAEHSSLDGGFDALGAWDANDDLRSFDDGEFRAANPEYATIPNMNPKGPTWPPSNQLRDVLHSHGLSLSENVHGQQGPISPHRATVTHSFPSSKTLHTALSLNLSPMCTGLFLF